MHRDRVLIRMMDNCVDSQQPLVLLSLELGVENDGGGADVAREIWEGAELNRIVRQGRCPIPSV